MTGNDHCKGSQTSAGRCEVYGLASGMCIFDEGHQLVASHFLPPSKA
ncbi:MAG: hypothetical protein INR62_01275 [Rhodospirillales bacterium]|nr:hypothetical protein [Acetobacter sp.]